MSDFSIGAEDLLSTVGESMGLIVMVWELEAQEIFASPQWALLVGGLPGMRRIPAAQLRSYIHPDDISVLDIAVLQCIKGQQTFYDIEIRVLAKTGDWHWLSGRGRVALRNDAQQVTRMVATLIEAGNRRLTEQALADSEVRYRATFDSSLQAILLITPDGQILSANPAACTLLGYSKKELLDQACIELSKLADERLPKLLQQCLSMNQCHGAAVLRRKDGIALEVESSLALFTERSGATRVSIEMHDVTHARQIERRLQRITQMYDARSRCSRALIDSQTREELLRAVCKLVVDCGDFGLVWIAWVKNDSLEVGAAYASGTQRNYLKEARISLDPKDVLGQGPMARAIRQSEVVVINDFLCEPSLAPWHALAKHYRLHSTAIFPLKGMGETIGALNLYASEKDYFDEPLISLLAEMANDVSFGLTNLQRNSALQSSETRFRTLWETSTDAILMLTEASIIRFANPALEGLLGYAPDSLIGESLEILQPVRFRQHHIIGMGNYLRTGHRTIDWRAAQVCALHRDGREIPVEIAFSQADIGSERLFVGFIRDMTERKRSTDLMVNQNRILKMISSSADLPQTLAEVGRLVKEHLRCLVCTIQILPDDSIQSVARLATTPAPVDVQPDVWRASVLNDDSAESAACITYTLEELFADPALPYLHAIAPHYDADSCRLWPIIGRQKQLVAYLAIFYQNSAVVTVAELNLVPIACELAALAIENKKSDERIRYLAHFDELTELPNRANFLQMLSQAIARAERHGKQVGVLFIDLDRFKRINDMHGHHTGDTVLHEVACRLRGALREVDQVARLGGDEFVILVEEVINGEVLGAMAQKLIEKISLPFYINDDEFHLTASVGISIFPADGDDLYALIKNADMAMYRVKELGRNGHQFYSEKMSSDTHEKIILEAGLRRVVERNELVMHYQPKLDLITGQVTGVEALVRWQHPELGLLGPNKFIPLAEETGSIVAIGRWVLQTACRQLSEWINSGMAPLRMAVNLSARQFRYGMLFQDVEQALRQAGLAPHLLELEVTESLVMDNPDYAVQLLARFKTLGIELSMDDFGTGYSSLANLKSFPFDTVKIDRSFVRDIVIDLHDAAITRAIIAMAHVLHLRVTAEGVETAEQMNFLREHDCDEIQGYHFAPPMPTQATEEFLRARQVSTLKNVTV